MKAQAPAQMPEKDMERVVEQYGTVLYRACLVTLGNHADAEDALQETLLKYLCKSPVFRDGEHEKAWLIRVAVNQCRDAIRARKRREKYERESERVCFLNAERGEEDGRILDALCSLPEKFKTVLFLHYVEEYKVSEIAELLSLTQSAVKMRLQKGRTLLEAAYKRGNIQ